LHPERRPCERRAANGEGDVTTTTERRDGLVQRLFDSSLGMGEVLTVYLGDKLGLYEALRAGPASSSELGERAGVFERYAREWLEQQAAAGILDVDDASAEPGARRYSISPGVVEVLLDPESPYAMAAMCKSFVALAGAMPALLDAFRTGGPVTAESYGADMTEAQGDFNRPWLVGSLATEYLPSVPDLHERLSAGAAVADVACGVGWAGISLAKAYPAITVDGFDLDELAISLARENARRSGVDDRVAFHLRDAADPSDDARYDLAIVGEAIHDLSHPVPVLRAIRRMLRPGGTLIVADERVEDDFTAPAGEIERLFYAYSVLTCLPGAMDAPDSAATGTVMRRSTFERYARDAGFDAVSELPFEHDFLRFYRLDA
jgi:2-polyprenyl-3-methyl-5-hydroxy-6-metoxy-1,4-benzoquinol methylase